jgi:hypothetical protein
MLREILLGLKDLLFFIKKGRERTLQLKGATMTSQSVILGTQIFSTFSDAPRSQTLFWL